MKLADMFPRDKVLHLVAGLGVAFAAALVYWLLVALGLVPLAGIVAQPAIAALVAGATKEAADWLDNRGQAAPVHDVSRLDLAFTVAPGLLLSVVAYYALAA